MPLSKTWITTVLLAATAAGAPGQAIHATIDAARTREPISNYLYGQFIEHIAGIINNGLWAEMLDDRKFYYPVTARAAATGPPQARRAPLRRWTPIGPEDSIVMDTTRQYAGDHTPLVKLNGAEPGGIQQAGLTVRKGKSYTGRVVLAGDPGAKVAITLVWGNNANERQTVSAKSLRSEYVKVPLSFQA
ncbi:MAG: alpha-N-arabinofuranosidase, partial [Bryobacteraceae bacterium]